MTARTACEPGTSENEARAADEFVALVCDDAELLNEEFNAIVAFNWGPPPDVGWPSASSGGSRSRGGRGVGFDPDFYRATVGADRTVPRWVLPRAPPAQRGHSPSPVWRATTVNSRPDLKPFPRMWGFETTRKYPDCNRLKPIGHPGPRDPGTGASLWKSPSHPRRPRRQCHVVRMSKNTFGTSSATETTSSL